MVHFYTAIYSFFVQINICPLTVVGNDFVILYPTELMVREKNYAWNGPNFPAIHTEKSILASLSHNGGFQLISEGLLPDHFKADFDALLENLVSEPEPNNWLLSTWRKVRGFYYFVMVDLFGARYIKTKSKVYTIV